MSTKISLIQNILSIGWGKISSVFIRLLQVPLLLTTLGVDEYGQWLVISSIPSWLTLANLGFGSVASNEISIAIAAGSYNRARGIFSSSLALMLIITIMGSIISIIISPFISWEYLLIVPSNRHSELTLTVIWLAISVFLSFSSETFGGRLRAARKAYVAVNINSLRPWLDLLAMFVVLQYTTRFDYLAFASVFCTVIHLGLLKWFSKRALPTLSFSLANIQIKEFKYLFQKGISFQAIPLGNALLFQGNLLVIQTILGSSSVALFATARMLVRSVNQFFELTNQAIWPEISLLFGSNDLAKIARLHRISVGVSTVLACISVFFLAFFGQIFYEWWTGKAIELTEHLLLFFLIPIPFNAFWYTSSVVHMASNQHEGLALRYLISSGLTIVMCIIFSYYQGIEGAALSTLLMDLILIPYVLTHSLALTGDSWNGFVSGLFQEVKLIHKILKQGLVLIMK